MCYIYIYMLLSGMFERLIVSACVVEVCGTIGSATSDLHIVVTCFDSTIILLPCFKKISGKCEAVCWIST